MSAGEKACCTNEPIPNDYSPKGTYSKVGGIQSYSIGPANSKLAVVFIPDIFGFHNSSLLTADKLSQALNARVVCPDYFDGAPFEMSRFPLKNPNELKDWLAEKVPSQKTHDYSTKVFEGLKQGGHQIIGTTSLCWGAQVALGVANTDKFAAGHVLFHPSFVTTEQAHPVQAPILLIPSKDEADMIPFMEVLKQEHPELYKKSGHFRFDDMPHGFCGARADWENAENSKRTLEAISHAKDFFTNNIQ